jgi:hypothetical protein
MKKKNLLTENYFPKLDQWFHDMDTSFNKIKEAHEKGRINSMLNDNDINIIN